MASFYITLITTIALHTCNAQGVGPQGFAGRLGGSRLRPPPPPDEAAMRDHSVVKTNYFEQPLDHFNESVPAATWKQCYQVNEAIYKEGGPIFIMISGETSIDSSWLTYGQMYQNAIKHNALMFQLEHRFYGSSHPTSDLSTENLRYLNSVQALADLDAFIKGMKAQYKIPDAKVIVFGGSYAGNLVVWYRVLYPDASVGGVASSAPVLAEEDFIEYTETVGNAQSYYSPHCYDALRLIFGFGMSSILLCDGTLNLTDQYEIETFYSSLIGVWEVATQYNSVGSSSTVAKLCQTMTQGDPLDGLSKVFKSRSFCAEHDYQRMVEDLKQDSWTSRYSKDGTRQWVWQTCTEFAYYQTTDGKNQPFGYRSVDINFFEDLMCTQPFNITHEDITAYVALNNQRYGGKSPNATNVFWFNGSIDPWHTLSVYDHDPNPSSPSRYIEGTSHCYDMYEARHDDPPALTKARQEMAEALSLWLSN